MADDKKKRGYQDRAKVSSTQRYDVDHLAKKTELPPQLVRKVIEQRGPSRTRVENYLNQMKRNGRR